MAHVKNFNSSRNVYIMERLLIRLTMKRLSHIIPITFAATLCGLASCDAVWDTSLDSGTPYSYYYGWDGEWLPTLPGAPLISPYYYGGSAYPIGGWGPVHRPGYGPVIAPVRPNTPSGTIRPGQSATPLPPASTRPSKPAVPANPLPTGSNPGLQVPPPGTGITFHPDQGRH